MAPNTTLTLRLCAVALLRNNVVRLHDGRFRHLLFIYANLGTLERVDHILTLKCLWYIYIIYGRGCIAGSTAMHELRHPQLRASAAALLLTARYSHLHVAAKCSI